MSRRRPRNVTLAVALLTVAAFIVFLTMGFIILPSRLLSLAVMIMLCAVPALLLRGSHPARLMAWGITGLAILRLVVAWAGADDGRPGAWRLEAGYFAVLTWGGVLLLVAASILLATPSANAFFRSRAAKPRINPKIWN